VFASGTVGVPVPEEKDLLAGVFATGAVGVFVPQDTITLTGVVASGVVGAVTAEDRPIVAGVSAAGLVGSLTSEIDLFLDGLASVGLPGGLVFPQDASVDLVGVFSIGLVGDLSTEIPQEQEPLIWRRLQPSPALVGRTAGRTEGAYGDRLPRDRGSQAAFLSGEIVWSAGCRKSRHSGYCDPV